MNKIIKVGQDKIIILQIFTDNNKSHQQDVQQACKKIIKMQPKDVQKIMKEKMDDPKDVVPIKRRKERHLQKESDTKELQKN